MSPFTQSGRLVWRAQQGFLPASQVGSDPPKPGPRCWEGEEEEAVITGLGKLRKRGPCCLHFAGMLLLLEDVA